MYEDEIDDQNGGGGAAEGMARKIAEARKRRAKLSMMRDRAREARDYLELVNQIAQVEQAYPCWRHTPIHRALAAIRMVAFDELCEIGDDVR